ncbi:MAG: universal stress protein [Candidatus Sericytochromatia bacterium]|nr:universal stress protein [Candidatus Sericytochromatia bacterium]
MKVLIATDGSSWSHQAVRRAASLLPLADAEVHLVSIAEVVALIALGEFPLGGASAAREQSLARTETDARQAASILEERGIRLSVHTRHGEPAEEIVALANELGVDIIVLGSHEKNSLERLFIGSISDAVLRKWSGATVVIHPQVDEGKRGDPPQSGV